MRTGGKRSEPFGGMGGIHPPPPVRGRNVLRVQNNMSEVPELTSRQKLEEFWRGKLQEAQEQYETATAEYRKVLQDQTEGQNPSPNGSLARAHQAESDALAEYTRVLQVFTELTVHGKVPEEEPSVSADGAPR